MALKRASFISADVQSDVLSSSRIPVKNRNRFLHWPTASSLRQWHFVMLPHVSMRHCFESQLSRHFCRSYLKSNKVSKSKGTRKVEYAYNFWKCADAVHLKSSRSIHAWRNYSLPKLALILKQCMCKVNGQKENYMRLLPIFNSILTFPKIYDLDYELSRSIKVKGRLTNLPEFCQSCTFTVIILLTGCCPIWYDVQKISSSSWGRLRRGKMCLPCAYLVWPCLEVNPHDKA